MRRFYLKAIIILISLYLFTFSKIKVSSFNKLEGLSLSDP